MAGNAASKSFPRFDQSHLAGAKRRFLNLLSGGDIFPKLARRYWQPCLYVSVNVNQRISSCSNDWLHA
jgi:hypothetical protein